MVAAVYDWTGFYIGVNGGWGTSRQLLGLNTTVGGVPFAPASEGCHDADGGTVGGQVGYRWQAGNWVFGLEAQGNWADFSGSQREPASAAPLVNRSQDRRVRPVHRPDRLRLPTTSCSTSRAVRR